MNQEAAQDVHNQALSELRQAIEQADQTIDELKTTTRKKQQEFDRLVKEYATKRFELLIEEFKRRGLTWCTNCSTVISQDDAKLVVLEGTSTESCGYENSCYRFYNFSALHR